MSERRPRIASASVGVHLWTERPSVNFADVIVVVLRIPSPVKRALLDTDILSEIMKGIDPRVHPSSFIFRTFASTSDSSFLECVSQTR
jgi:hypothetical protein